MRQPNSPLLLQNVWVISVCRPHPGTRKGSEGKTYEVQNKTADSSGSCQVQLQRDRNSSKFTAVLSDQNSSVINIVPINHVGKRKTVRREGKAGLLPFNKLSDAFIGYNIKN